VIWDQAEYDLRCEWGLAGVQTLAPISDVLIVVDVLVFSTAVDIAVARGASVLPYRWRDSSAEAFAKSKGALLASPRSAGGYSLSPLSLQSIPAGTALVLPSPNGSTLCLPPRPSRPVCETAARWRPIRAPAVHVSPSFQPESSGATARSVQRSRI
jgi:2-phosphosulfolactate phosphatase